jgi:hypothetical protein
MPEFEKTNFAMQASIANILCGNNCPPLFSTGPIFAAKRQQNEISLFALTLCVRMEIKNAKQQIKKNRRFADCGVVIFDSFPFRF